MTDEELIKILYEHGDRLIATVDELGEPFHSIGTIRLSAERKDGVERKIILWLEPEPLDDNWEPLEENDQMKYDQPITSVEHARWCLAEAARRYYHGKIVWNEDCFPLVEDAAGVCHTDEILRAVGAMLMPESFSPFKTTLAELLGEDEAERVREEIRQMKGELKA